MDYFKKYQHKIRTITELKKILSKQKVKNSFMSWSI